MDTDILLEKYSKEISGFEEKFGIRFNDKRRLIEALDHTADNSEKKKQYALAGDALLDLILFDYLLEKGGYSRGKMDCIRKRLNTDENLALIGRSIGLGEFIIFPISATDGEKESSKAYYNDTVEALVYLIMKDQCLESSVRFAVENILSKIPSDEYGCENCLI